MVEFVLHAGLHKTATTSLQELVFPNIKNVTYTGKTREVILSRREKRSHLLAFLGYATTEQHAIDRLPLHTCQYYLSLTQDHLIAILSRSDGSLQLVKDLLAFNHLLLNRISELVGPATIFYSCEGLLLTLGQLHPEFVIAKQTKQSDAFRRDLPPLFRFRKLFPGRVSRVVIYLRSPIEYLFSRYIQVHTVRLSSGVSTLLGPADYLKLQGQLFDGPNKYQSVFFHVFQHQLSADLAQLGVPVRLRSFEDHIKDCSSINKEIGKAFGLEVHNPSEVDAIFKLNALNSTEKDKANAINALCSHLGSRDADDLKQQFLQQAQANTHVQAALAERVFAY